MKWVSVKDKLPESTVQVLCIGNKGKHQFVGFYTKGKDVEVADDGNFGDNDCSDQDYCYLKPGWFEEEETPHSEYDYTYCHRDKQQKIFMADDKLILTKEQALFVEADKDEIEKLEQRLSKSQTA